MAEQPIKFNDGAAYERMMGTWSRLVGDVFLDWLKPEPGQRWIDIGCGNGAFTENIVARCAPAEILGVDPSQEQLDYARMRPAAQLAKFQQGNAMALPCAAKSFDAAVMALVIFFVPDPAKGVAEMARVVKPGGTVSAYAWDVFGGGVPTDPIFAELRAMGVKQVMPPSVEASRLDVLRDLWTNAGLEAVETRVISVERTFADFDDMWTTTVNGSGVVTASLAGMSEPERETLKAGVRARMPVDASGRLTQSAFANAVKGRVPA
ncbi:MAG TPA: methyltransferase domain-containing protein [Pseudolabrys sp.]|nr:methyltransferase domain-containing protein [Pseudolabrys sp.]